MSIKSARSALAWAGGVQLFQDIAQFLAMLLLVRLLSPAQYGSMALAQSVVSVFTLFGPSTFVGHALQARDPAAIDWQSHYTASTVTSVLIAAPLLVLAVVAAPSIWGDDVGIALAVLAVAVLLGSPAHLRNTYLHAHHDWARYRLLSLAGTCFGISAGISLAAAGYGILALAVQPVLYVLPSAIDQMFSGFKPTWHFDRAYYRDVIQFGLNRFTAGSLSAVRNFGEQSLMAAHFSLAANGVYGRSVGLSNLLAGRFGWIALSALYPILTRAAPGSAQFRRNAGRVLQGVAWIAIPAATFLAIESVAIVDLLYGQGWAQVAPLLPAVSVLAAAGAMQVAVSRLLLANDSRRASLAIEAGPAVLSLILAFTLLPIGIQLYVQALAAVSVLSVLCGALLLLRAGAVDRNALVVTIVPPALAACLALVCLTVISSILQQFGDLVRLVLAAAIFGAVYFAVLAGCTPRPLAELVNVLPGGLRLSSFLAASIERKPAVRQLKRKTEPKECE